MATGGDPELTFEELVELVPFLPTEPHVVTEADEEAEYGYDQGDPAEIARVKAELEGDE